LLVGGWLVVFRTTGLLQSRCEDLCWWSMIAKVLLQMRVDHCAICVHDKASGQLPSVTFVVTGESCIGGTSTSEKHGWL